MGATAISVLAGALILRLPPASLGAAVHGVVAAAGGAVGVRDLADPAAAGPGGPAAPAAPRLAGHEPGMWRIVSPAGMCGVASRELGAALNVSWLVTLGRYEAWLALAAWPYSPWQ